MLVVRSWIRVNAVAWALTVSDTDDIAQAVRHVGGSGVELPRKAWCIGRVIATFM